MKDERRAAAPEEKTAENCEILFEYLRSILYDSEIRQPDFSRLDAPYENLGAGLRILQRFVEELKAYTEALSNGELSSAYPSRDNFLCSNLKNLHANLNHLTWQAKRVAEGDYSQHVSYLGEFSDSFNTMIRQLKWREESLHEQIEKTQRQMTIIEQYNQLFTDMMTRRNIWFVVVEAGTGKICYCNRQTDVPDETGCQGCGFHNNSLREIIRGRTPRTYQTWEWGDEQKGYYRISSLPTDWRGRNAFAHVIEEITEEKREEGRLMSQAYHDAGTGIYNRFFFTEYLGRMLSEHKSMVLCFMDLDGLKYVNDHFGHSEGDAYIKSFVAAIQRSFRATDIFARFGGDEFVLLLCEADEEHIRRKLERVRESFISGNLFSYPASFSYGLAMTDGEAEISGNEFVNMADTRMYEYKKEHKLQE